MIHLGRILLSCTLNVLFECFFIYVLHFKIFNAIRKSVIHGTCVLSCSDVSNSLRPYGSYSARLLCPWDSPGKNTGVGRHALLQGIFLTQGSNSWRILYLCYTTLRFFNRLTLNFFQNFFPKGSVFPQILSFAYHLHDFFFIYPMPSILLVMERELIFKNLNSL